MLRIHVGGVSQTNQWNWRNDTLGKFNNFFNFLATLHDWGQKWSRDKMGFNVIGERLICRWNHRRTDFFFQIHFSKTGNFLYESPLVDIVRVISAITFLKWVIIPVCDRDFFVLFLCLVILSDESSVFEALITPLTLSKIKSKISIHLIGRDRCVTWFSDWPKQNSRGAREEKKLIHPLRITQKENVSDFYKNLKKIFKKF